LGLKFSKVFLKMPRMKSPMPCPEPTPLLVYESQYRCLCRRAGLWDDLSQLCPVHRQPQILIRFFPTGGEAQRQ
jgi:hypothetical protein